MPRAADCVDRQLEVDELRVESVEIGSLSVARRVPLGKQRGEVERLLHAPRIIDGKVVSYGRIPSAGGIAEWLSEAGGPR